MKDKQMDCGAALDEWNSLRLFCGLTGKIIQDSDYTVWFPHFITDKEDSFWRYNELPMLREAFDGWEHKDAFLARWYESVQTHVIPQVNVLVSQADYLVWLAELPPTIVLNFLAHGFTLSIPRKEWKEFKSLLLKVPQRSGTLTFHLSYKWQISVRVEGSQIRMAYEPSSKFKKGKRDRILLIKSEWKALQKVLRDVDRLISRIHK